MKHWAGGKGSQASVGTLLGIIALSVAGCGNPAPSNGPQGAAPQTPSAQAAELVRPPFDVKGDCDGLLLIWFDADGPHTATKRTDVPEPHREQVRVESLSAAPGEQLDPAFVYLADLRAPARDGRYAVRKVARERFEELVDKASSTPPIADGPTDPAHGGVATADVIIYGASWCGACHAAASFFTSQGIAFVEKDIEQDAAARAEMQRKAARAGVSTDGIPVIDFHGHILAGFDQNELQRLILESTLNDPQAPAAPPPGGRAI